MACLFCNGKTPPPGASCKFCKRQGEPAVRHTCHADGCNIEVPPKMLMCIVHWRLVPREVQKRVWAAYVPGQEIKKNPTREYLAVMKEAVRAVAAREGRVPGE